MKKFAVFDIDGTLIRWQLYHALVDELAKMDLIEPALYLALKNHRMKWKNRESDESFKNYERKLIEVFETCLINISPQQLEIAAKSVVETYSNQTYTFTRRLVDKLKDEYVLIAISGSHEELVRQIANRYGFEVWVGTKYKRKDDKFTGEKKIASKDKQSVLRKIISENDLTVSGSYGVGDSYSDISMLEIVDNPIAFNPDKPLLEAAKQRHWDIVLERKNVIYKLKHSGENYVLA
jgi:HAD superfamily hydrolase (TIGR01490 family)